MSFTIKKVKLQDDKGIVVEFQAEKVQGDVHHVVEKSHKSPIPRHPDMDKAADQLKIHVARIFKLGGVEDLKVGVKISKAHQDRLAKAIESISINSVSFTGSEDNETAGILISAKMKTLNNRTVVLNTPNLMFGDEANYGYISILEDEAEDLAMEVRKYLEEQKYAQLTIFQDQGEAA